MVILLLLFFFIKKRHYSHWFHGLLFVIFLCILFYIAEPVFIRSQCKLGHVTFTNRYEVSHCTWCHCFNGKIVCLKRNSNGKKSLLCSRCSRIPSRECTYCQIPHNRSSIVPINHEISMNRSKIGECITCHCTNQGSVHCKYLEATICQNVVECEKTMVKLPKTDCSYCVGSAPKKFNLSYSEITLHCLCKTPGHFKCNYSALFGGVIEYKRMCSGEVCTQLNQTKGKEILHYCIGQNSFITLTQVAILGQKKSDRVSDIYTGSVRLHLRW